MICSTLRKTLKLKIMQMSRLPSAPNHKSVVEELEISSSVYMTSKHVYEGQYRQELSFAIWQ